MALTPLEYLGKNPKMSLKNLKDAYPNDDHSKLENIYNNFNSSSSSTNSSSDLNLNTTTLTSDACTVSNKIVFGHYLVLI